MAVTLGFHTKKADSCGHFSALYLKSRQPLDLMDKAPHMGTRVPDHSPTIEING